MGATGLHSTALAGSEAGKSVGSAQGGNTSGNTPSPSGAGSGLSAWLRACPVPLPPDTRSAILAVLAAQPEPTDTD